MSESTTQPRDTGTNEAMARLGGIKVIASPHLRENEWMLLSSEVMKDIEASVWKRARKEMMMTLETPKKFDGSKATWLRNKLRTVAPEDRDLLIKDLRAFLNTAIESIEELEQQNIAILAEKPTAEEILSRDEKIQELLRGATLLEGERNALADMVERLAVKMNRGKKKCR